MLWHFPCQYSYKRCLCVSLYWDTLKYTCLRAPTSPSTHATYLLTCTAHISRLSICWLALQQLVPVPVCLCLTRLSDFCLCCALLHCLLFSSHLPLWLFLTTFYLTRFSVYPYQKVLKNLQLFIVFLLHTISFLVKAGAYITHDATRLPIVAFEMWVCFGSLSLMIIRNRQNIALVLVFFINTINITAITFILFRYDGDLC